MDTRKLVSLPADLAQLVDDFRFENRIATESEAIRRLIELGLKAASDAAKEA
jgi:metal-responsive CopG/Arc/MetJ family transcriptional regulator